LKNKSLFITNLFFL